MNQGVISSHFPYIPIRPIRFQVRLHTYETEALVDTGFDGGIAIPTSLLENLGPPDGYELWGPVVGAPVLADVYHGSFQVDALGPFPVPITALGDEVLVGLEVIIRFIVTFDHGQRLVVEA